MSFMTSLWRSSKLEQLLETATEFTEEMLSQEDVFEEARFMSEKLCKLLSTPGACRLLLQHMLAEPPAPGPDSAPQPKRLAAVSCEILNLGLAGMTALLFDDDAALLTPLAAFFQRPPPLPVPTVAYACKVLGMLAERCKGQMGGWLLSRGLITALVQHLPQAPVGDLLLAIAKADERTAAAAGLVPRILQLELEQACPFLLEVSAGRFHS